MIYKHARIFCIECQLAYYLNQDEYNEQMMNADKTWVCPYNHDNCNFDDRYFDEMQEKIYGDGQ